MNSTFSPRNQGVTAETRDLKKLLGNPKITFVLGGPASGKGTQCAKIVEEFGFTHISVGDLMREEVQKKTKEGEQILEIQKGGGLVPFQLTVQILINGLISNPGSNYLIDGFPRAIDQATFFEKNVVEAHQILFYNVPQEIMIERCMKRAESSDRADDNAETIKARVQTYFDQTLPVVDFYKKFGKVVQIDATGSIAQVYAETKKALLPQVLCILGAVGSGRDSVAKVLAERTNLRVLDFNQYIEENCLQDQDDDTIVSTLIQSMAQERFPRITLKNFPQNINQAKYLMRNGTTPTNVFSLVCPLDKCQERMIELGQGDPKYMSSADLSLKIKEYNDSVKTLMPFLRENTSFKEISNDQDFDKTIQTVMSHIEPMVIHVRSGAKANDLKQEIVNSLSEEHGFVNLDVSKCMRGEAERGTVIGEEFYTKLLEAKNPISDQNIVKMLQKIIYCGQESINKFILTNFPDNIEQVEEFEKNCASIAAIIYPTDAGPTIEIKNNNLQYSSIDSMFQQKFKLKVMDHWSKQLFDEKLGNKTSYGFIVGRATAGKTFLSNQMKALLDYEVISMADLTENVRKSMGDDDTPFEGEVPIEKVEQAVMDQIESTKATSIKPKFVFDGYTHASHESFWAFVQKIGMPEFAVFLTIEDANIKNRIKVKKELDELTEENLEDIKKQEQAYKVVFKGLQEVLEPHKDKMQVIMQSTDKSEESTVKQLINHFAIKVLLVNHIPKYSVETQCSNISIKYNMVYLSATKIIKNHIEKNTEWGAKLLQSKKEKAIEDQENGQYLAVHYDLPTVLNLLKDTLTLTRTNQRYVIIEGLCSQSLTDEDNQMELRVMDEFFTVEQIIGEVVGVCTVGKTEDPLVLDNVEKIEFAESVKEEASKQQTIDPDAVDGGEDPPADPAPEDPNAKPAFNPKDYEWTMSNRRPRNLALLYKGCKEEKQTKFVVKPQKELDQVQNKAIAMGIDQFCGSIGDVNDKGEPMNQYHQVIMDY